MEDAAGAPVTVFAPAKLNLYLHVVDRRADGYHELDSLVAFADIGDSVTAAPAADLSLAIDGPFAGALAGDAADNLVLRAARLLGGRYGIKAGAALRLTKSLPVASGIGGGSGDAAATLRALAALWRVAVEEESLAELGLKLGADVPVCLAGRPTWLGGIGERLAPAGTLPGLGVVLVNPGIALSTPAVFRARSGTFSAPARFAVPADPAGLVALLAERRNDLEAPAIGLVPDIADVLTALRATPAARLARMSGSGATCFALYETGAAAEHAAAELGARHRGWWVASGRLLPDASPRAGTSPAVG